MVKQTLLVIGLIGGILAAVGVFLSWASVPGLSISGWDGRSDAPEVYVILIGGILALIGAIAALPGVKYIGLLVPTGGIIAILGWIAMNVHAGTWSGWAYGFYTCLVGGILALIFGIAGVAVKE